MIPKKIHYCWFGKGKKDKLFYKCLESWKKYFPDYEIIEWNEDNFDINYNDYVKEAYECGKFAFVSDVARLKVIYDYGGIYFDTDVEVLKKFDDNLLEYGYFGEEREKYINTGLGFAAPPKSKIVKIMLDDYEKLHFVKIDGTLDLTPCPELNSRSLTSRGYVLRPNGKVDNIPTYSKEYIGGFDQISNHYVISDNTYSVHHYNASWLDSKEKKKFKLKRRISKIIGSNNYYKIRSLKHKVKKVIKADKEKVS